MKKIVILGMITVLLLALGAVSFMAVVKPPPGEHYTFNCVTKVDPVSGVLGANEILIPLNGSGMLGFKLGPTFEILDNDMTDGQAWVQIPAGSYDTFDQARGKPGGYLFWGNFHARATGKPVWEQHNDPLNWNRTSGNWPFTNNGVTCYSFRLYPF
ncbi:MAG: hypothetical protein KAW42_05750 [Candidatus Atribacteria bacterium]|nr:hypothetical protein [Candidatus Atribacteria bacterium]